MVDEMLQAQMDVQIYRAQVRRILAATLYFLQVDVPGQVLHKIGVTSRTIDERTAEIAAQLREHFDQVSIRTLDTWPHRGNVEGYFKFRYAPWQHPIGALTEYFALDDSARALSDLRRMRPKVLSDVEQEILTAAPAGLAIGHHAH